MITFENIKSGEKVTFTVEQDPVARQAHMAAYLNSSNLSPNALRGQDFGWRLAPDVVAEMERVRGDYEKMDTLARRIGVSVDDIRDFHILNYVADMRFNAAAMEAANRNNKNNNYQEEYDKRLKEIREGKQPVETKESKQVDSATETDSAKIDASTTKKEK